MEHAEIGAAMVAELVEIGAAIDNHVAGMTVFRESEGIVFHWLAEQSRAIIVKAWNLGHNQASAPTRTDFGLSKAYFHLYIVRSPPNSSTNDMFNSTTISQNKSSMVFELSLAFLYSLGVA